MWKDENTNIMVDIVFWNCMGCSLSLFVFFFDTMVWMAYAKKGVAKRKVTIWRFSEVDAVTLWFIFAAAALVIFICLLISSIPVMGSAILSAVMMPVLVAFFMVLIVFLLVLEAAAIEKNTGTYPMRKNIVFWIFFIIVAPFIVTSINMVLQRRDVTYNACSIIVAFCVGICALGMEYIQDGLTPLKESPMNPSMVKKKNFMIKTILICVAIMIALLISPNSPIFPASSFSNLYYLVIIVPVILVLPIFTMTRYLQQVSMCILASEMNNLLYHVAQI